MNARPKKPQWDEAGQWFVKADEDIRAARVLLDAAPPLLPSAAYHCQQVAEKLIKGLLAAAENPLQRTHDLDALAEMAMRDFPDLAEHLDFCRPLTSWGTIFRYPMIDADATMTPSRSEIAEAIERLADFRTAVGTQESREPGSGEKQ